MSMVTPVSTRNKVAALLSFGAAAPCQNSASGAAARPGIESGIVALLSSRIGSTHGAHSDPATGIAARPVARRRNTPPSPEAAGVGSEFAVLLLSAGAPGARGSTATELNRWPCGTGAHDSRAGA